MVKILQYLKQNRKEMLTDIENIVKKESPTLEKELVDECSNLLKNIIYERLGITVEEFANEKFGKHLKFSFGKGSSRILILTHYDTVWKKGALSFQSDKKRIY